MFGLFGVSLIAACAQLIKEICEPTIPAENWANKELYYEDIAKGVPVKQRMKNLENGKYRLKETYPEPHRNAQGKIVIENSQLYKEDYKKYGAWQTYKWVEQGKYNLTSEELKKERERIEKKFEYLYSLL